VVLRQLIRAFALLPLLGFHWARYHYYRIAVNHTGPVHPDAFLLSERMRYSRAVIDSIFDE